jgi:hypothetical protein
MPTHNGTTMLKLSGAQQRLPFSGPLGELLGRIVRRRLQATLASMTEQVAREAERRSSA